MYLSKKRDTRHFLFFIQALYIEKKVRPGVFHLDMT